MKILFCCQFYAPSVGGVQELIRQIAEKLVLSGHQVTVATSKITERDFDQLNGVNIEEFDIAGNLVTRMTGEVNRYQDFIISGPFDVMLVYAAQQWTFDALWPILEKIKYPKVFSPCGFSGLYEKGYKKYFQKMPEILKMFDYLVFNAEKYRDIDFALSNGIKNYSIIPNGASEEDFSVPADPFFRKHNSIPEQSFLFLTVGGFTGMKGHLELVQAFSRVKLTGSQHATLILNGNDLQRTDNNVSGLLRKAIGVFKTHGLRHAIKRIINIASGVSDSPKKVAELINNTQKNKHVLVADFPRNELVQAFMAADLFVFASKIEHSPLVLFESAAAGTPFLTVDVGNATEIAKWTGAGIVCPSTIDEKGYTNVDETELASSMSALIQKKEYLKEIGAAGKRNWTKEYTWRKVAARYEKVFFQLMKN